MHIKESYNLNSLDKFNYYLIASIFILAFTKGIPELLGFPESIIQLFIELLIFILFANSLFFILKRRRIRGPGLLINFYLLTIIFISFLFTNVSTLQLILFLRKFAVYYLFFYALFNINILSIYKDKLIKLIIILSLIQIPAGLIKVLVVGRMEKIIGTMSIHEGSLATIMPLMAISYLIANYLYYKQNKYILGIVLFTGVGLTSGKKALIFYIIALFLYIAYIYARPKYFIPKAVFMKKLFVILVFMTILFPVSITLNPTLNPEHKFGGSIDFEYLDRFITKYQTLDQKTGVEGDGRFDAPFVAFDRLYDGGMVNILFGFGPGEIIKSSYTRYKKPLLEKYNIGYGGRIGLVWTLMQIGFVGMILFLLFHILLFKKILNVYYDESTNKKFRVFALSTVGFSMIYIFDFFTYSTEMIQNTGMATVYYFAIYYVLSGKDYFKENK